MEIIKKMEENKLDESAVTYEANETANVKSEAQPVPPQSTTCKCESEQPSRCKRTPILSIILLVGLAVLYILHFAGIPSHRNSLANADAKAPIVAGEGGLKVAYINTDSLMDKYLYAKDLEKQLKDFQTAKENSYKQQMTQFQKDYDAYVKGGGDNMTLTQQQAKEKELTERMQRLQSLEAEYAQQIQERTVNESKKMTDAIYNFIREYNLQNQQFDLILARSYTSSPILYGNEGMDITDEIVKGLNEEYEKVKAEQ